MLTIDELRGKIAELNDEITEEENFGDDSSYDIDSARCRLADFEDELNILMSEIEG